jgi:hypothetical protein
MQQKDRVGLNQCHSSPSLAPSLSMSSLALTPPLIALNGQYVVCSLSLTPTRVVLLVGKASRSIWILCFLERSGSKREDQAERQHGTYQHAVETKMHVLAQGLNLPITFPTSFLYLSRTISQVMPRSVLNLYK